nr:hypothetical protein asmbl_42 [uncultured bacterium]
MATVDEIAPDIFRINLVTPGAPITTSFFLIRDEQPALVETGYRRTFGGTWEVVGRLLDPAMLWYVVVPHLEGDESRAQPLAATGLTRPAGRQPHRGVAEPRGRRDPQPAMSLLHATRGRQCSRLVISFRVAR